MKTKNKGAGKDEFVVLQGSVRSLVNNLKPVVDGIAGMFGRNCEVVLHDLRDPEKSVVLIANGHVSGRRIGSSLIEAPVDDKGLQLLLDPNQRANVLGGYLTRTRDGRILKSTSIVFRNSKGKAVASLCMNFDLTELNIANQFLSEMCMGNEAEGQKPRRPEGQKSTARNNMKATIKEIVDEAVGTMNRPVNLAQKADKLEALKTMHDRGLFLIRGSVDYAAEALGVSRFTIYNYLKEIRFKEIK